MLVTKHLMGPTDFHSMEKIIWKSMSIDSDIICSDTNNIQNIFFWVQQKREMNTGLKQLRYFWVKHPFKFSLNSSNWSYHLQCKKV